MTPKPPIIAFTAGKGGCGKTTLSINFAYNVFKANNRVLLVDFDLSNRGSSGVFADQISAASQTRYWTVVDTLNSHTDHSKKNIDLIEIRDGYFFIPASRIGKDIKVNFYEERHIPGLINTIKTNLYKIAQEFNIDCIVLDCFCGIDTLTTTGICLSDDAIFINEPDIITFTGTIYLHRHVVEQLDILSEKGFVKPTMHLIINRLKSDFSVADLNIIYEKNLLIEFPNGAECHFPYNEKIFRNFGKYPFWEDVLPNSLFIKKMNLLTWQIFKGEHNKLLKKDVKKWNDEKAAKIYLKSKDYGAIESEALLLEFIDLVTYAGFLMGAYYLFNYRISLAPITTFIFFLILFLLSFTLYCRKLVWPLYLATRLNFSVAMFKYRLKKVTGKGSWINSSNIFFRFFTAIVMMLSSIMVVVFLGIETNKLLVYSGLQKKVSFVHVIRSSIPDLALKDTTFVNKLDLSSSEIEDVDFTDSLNVGLKKRSFGNAHLKGCTINLSDVQSNPKFKNVTYNSSNIIFNSDRFEVSDGLASLFRKSYYYADYIDYKKIEQPTEYYKFLILDQIKFMERKYASIGDYLTIDTPIQLKFALKSNHIISPLTANNKVKKQCDLLIFSNVTIKQTRYDLDSTLKMVFFNCAFTGNIDSLKRNKNIYIIDRDSVNRGGNGTINSPLADNIYKILIKEPDPKLITDQCKNLDNTSLEYLTAFNILLNEVKFDSKIKAYLQKMNDKNGQGYNNHSPVLETLWKLVRNSSKKEMDSVFNKSLVWCDISSKYSGPVSLTRFWSTWDEYSSKVLKLTQKQWNFAKFYEATCKDAENIREVNRLLQSDAKITQSSLRKSYYKFDRANNIIYRKSFDSDIVEMKKAYNDLFSK